MLKYVLLALVIAFTTQVPQALAETSMDALLLRIDKLILEMELIKKEVKALQGSSGVPSVQGAASSRIFTESLEYGATNDDIGKIQKLLATDPLIYPYGVVSGFFGPKTEEAIRNLQTRFGLDPVGAIGPATTALLEGYLRMYPNENYPADVLSKKPQVLGVSTTVPPKPTTPAANSSSNPLLLIDVEIDWKESSVDVRYKDGDREHFFTDSDDEDDIVDAIARRLDLTEAQIREVISFEEFEDEDDDEDSDADEDEADEAIEDAEDALDDAEAEVDEADADGDDVDYALDTLEEAEDALQEAEDALEDEDYDEAVDKAEEAEELAEKAVDRIGEEEDEEDEEDGEKGDSDDIESIEVDVDDGESEITVEYGDSDEYSFSIEEDKTDEIIEAVAEELDMDEGDVEDLIEFNFGSIDDISALIGESETQVTVNYSSGVARRFTVNETDENEIIDAVAEELDEDDGDVEDLIEFDIE